MRRLVVCLVLTCLTVAPSTVAADEPVNWQHQWPRYRLSEGVATGVFVSGTLAMRYGLDHPPEAHWRGGILVDDPLRNVVEADSHRTANTFGTTSDILTGTMVAYPLLVDAVAVPWLAHDEPGVAAELVGMGLESFGAAGVLMVGLKHLVARQRPPSDKCAQEGGRNLYCSKERFESFPSGHTTLAFTGASFMCAVHENLDLYGGGLADRVACWTGIGLATGSGVARMVSGNHYFTDVAAGALIGFGSGYVLPKLLHFGFGKRGASSASKASLTPVATGDYHGFHVTWRY